MVHYNLSDKKNYLELKIAGQIFTLLKMKDLCSKKVGLLNHKSILYWEGIAYKNTKIFHTFGMNFPILVLCFNKEFQLIAKPLLVEQNRIFLAPQKTKYTFEMHSKVFDLFEKPNSLKDIKIFSNKKSIFFIKTYKNILYLFLLIMVFLISYGVLAEEQIKISLGRTRVLDLGKPPLTIQIADPDILEVERIGLTNSIKIIPKQEGESKITIIYPAGDEVNWNVSIGNKNKNLLSSPLDSSISALSLNHSSSAISILAKKINKIPGLKSSMGGEKIIIIGELKNYNHFLDLSKIIGSNPTLFFPAFEIPTQFEMPIMSSLQGDLRLFGERNLKIINRRGILTVVGVPSSPAGKTKSWNYLSGLVPNIVDAMSLNVGDSSMVQINLDFLELSKGENTEFGFTQPIFGSVGSELNFPAGLISKGLQEPTLQIGPISSLFKALQNSSFARELAKPVVITRSGEKASFLAGGEVPIVTATSTSASTTSAVTYKPFGILFNVTPRVQVDGSIWIKLDLEVSQVAEDLSYQKIPGFSSRKINTSLILNEGNTALLSGLVQNKDVKQVQKIPILGSIPIIGELFKSRRFQDSKSELWIVITARRTDQEDKSKFSSNFVEEKFKSAKIQTSGGLLD